jgi:AsmA protein
MAREISMDSLGNSVSGDQKTDFAELSATFVIENGVVTNDDLFMAAPLVRLDGKGNVNLPPRTLDYSIGLKAVASLEGQGTSGEEEGIGLPILVRGPWSDPTIGPDLEALAKDALSDPAAVGEQLENLGVDDGGLLENLDGEGESGSDGATDVIEGLFD